MSFSFLKTIWPIVFFLISLSSKSMMAQSNQATANPVTAPPAAANPVTTNPVTANLVTGSTGQQAKGTGLEFLGLSRKSQGRARPGRMLVLRAKIRNNSDMPAEGELVGELTGYSGDEFRRHIRLEAKEERYFDLAIRILPKLPGNMIEISVTLRAIENGREILLQGRDDETVFHTLDLMLVDRKSMYAMLLESSPPQQIDWRWPPTERHSTYDFSLSSGIDAGLSRAAAMLDTSLFPLSLADWDALDLLVISDPTAFDDAASIRTMQQFLQRGGRIWIMVDRVDTAKIRELFQPWQQCETVDEVDLEQLVVDVHSPNNLSEAERTVKRDTPIRMKRLMQQGGKVSHSVDGWPIAIWMPVGNGEVLLTALDSAAWLVQTKKHRSADPNFQSDYQLAKWSADFASLVHERRSPVPLSRERISYPLERIGNPVVSFGLVGAVLCGFCGILILFGCWRLFTGNLNWVGASAPVASLLACLPLLVVAMQMRHEIPSQVSKLQFVQLGKQGGMLFEQAAVYKAEGHAMTLSYPSDGIFRTSANSESGVRVTKNKGFQHWSLSNENWPSGTFRYQTEVVLKHPAVLARAELTSSGLSIEIPDQLPTPIEDMVVQFVPGNVSIGKTNTASNRLLIDGQFEAAGERWTTDTLMSTEQLRRAAVYRELFDPAANSQQLPPRMLYGWCGLWQETPKWNVDLQERGASLVSIPIELSVPPIGTEVLIPHSLISLEPPSENDGVTMIYNFALGSWIAESTLNTNADMSVVLPSEVLPIEAASVRIEWDVKAPNRKFRLLHHANGKLNEIVSLSEPSVPGQITIKDPVLLADLQDGRADIRIEVTDLKQESERSEVKSFITWRVKHLRFSVSGKTLPHDSLVAEPTIIPSN